MDQQVRAEIEKLHERVSGLKERVVNLEAQQPHINAALARIEGSVDKLANRIGKAIWAVLTPVIVLVVGVVFKIIVSGSLAQFAP
jgi:predicted nuclease with TOPRIM domain